MHLLQGAVTSGSGTCARISEEGVDPNFHSKFSTRKKTEGPDRDALV